jgi:metal-responsive CopG/Arc/MetJ family transcriptional regulator
MGLVVISVKLEEKTVRELENLAQRLGTTKSSIIREALREYLRKYIYSIEEKEKTEEKPPTHMKEKRILIRI